MCVLSDCVVRIETGLCVIRFHYVAYVPEILLSIWLQVHGQATGVACRGHWPLGTWQFIDWGTGVQLPKRLPDQFPKVWRSFVYRPRDLSNVPRDCTCDGLRAWGRYQCRINYGSGGSPEPGPLNSGPHNFTEIIFIHTKYIKKIKTVHWSVYKSWDLYFKNYLISAVLEIQNRSL